MAGLDQLRAQLNVRCRARRLAWPTVAVIGLALACSDPPARATGRATSQLSSGEGGSPVSLDSALTLFRQGLAPLEDLEGGESSIDAAITRLARIVESSDTVGLRAIVMSRREFAYLYYPTSPFTRFPTLQEPGLAWFLHVENSQKGATRLFNRYAGKSLRIIGTDCKSPPRVEGENRLWDDCVQQLVANSDTTAIRLIGGIYERNGRFKIFSYGGDL